MKQMYIIELTNNVHNYHNCSTKHNIASNKNNLQLLFGFNLFPRLLMCPFYKLFGFQHITGLLPTTS